MDRFRDLFEVLEDLIKRLADTEDPTIRGMRAKVRADLVALAGDVTPILQYSKQSWGRSTPAHAPRRAPPRRAGDLEVARRMDLLGGAAAALTGFALAMTLLPPD